MSVHSGPATARPLPSAGDDPAGRVAARLRGVIGTATLAMLGLSWPLWVEPSDFPRIPFVSGLPAVAPEVSWALFGLLVGSLLLMTTGIAWRAAAWLCLAVLGVLVLADQQRFQAWVYQFGMLTLILAALPARQSLTLVRVWMFSTYAYSGLSKLDVSFCRELGERFLAVACLPLGLEPGSWPTAVRYAAILAMPVAEILVAAGLALPGPRQIGRVGAVLLHLVLIAVLGPWGMRHSTIVLVWNGAMALEVWLAFDPRLTGVDVRDIWTGVRPLGRLAGLVLLAGVVLPLGERWGFCDAWPGHALYASHVERTEVFLHVDQVQEFPAEVRRHLQAGGPGPWQRLDLTGWSRVVRGVPVYPQGRTCNGVAEALAACYGDHHSIRVVQWSRADRWSGKRTQVAMMGLAEIRRQGDRYRLNAHPARAAASRLRPGAGPGVRVGVGEPAVRRTPETHP